jgi:hypothetical protein
MDFDFEEGEKLFQKIVQMNSLLLEKEKNISSVKIQLQTLENNINAQVDEFLKSLSVTQMNLQARFFEVQSNNQELRKIKDWILGANLSSDTFSQMRILNKLNILSMNEIYVGKDSNQSGFSKPENEFSLITRKRSRQTVEEDKYAPQKMPEKSLFERKDKKEENFEDNDFKLSINKRLSNQISNQVNADRQRTVSSSVIENRSNPQFLSNCFSEKLDRHAAGELGAFQQLQPSQLFSQTQMGLPIQPPAFPFLPNIQIDPETICQMLIRKLASNKTNTYPSLTLNDL